MRRFNLRLLAAAAFVVLAFASGAFGVARDGPAKETTVAIEIALENTTELTQVGSTAVVFAASSTAVQSGSALVLAVPVMEALSADTALARSSSHNVPSEVAYVIKTENLAANPMGEVSMLGAHAAEAQLMAVQSHLSNIAAHKKAHAIVATGLFEVLGGRLLTTAEDSGANWSSGLHAHGVTEVAYVIKTEYVAGNRQRITGTDESSDSLHATTAIAATGNMNQSAWATIASPDRGNEVAKAADSTATITLATRAPPSTGSLMAVADTVAMRVHSTSAADSSEVVYATGAPYVVTDLLLASKIADNFGKHLEPHGPVGNYPNPFNKQEVVS